MIEWVKLLKNHPLLMSYGFFFNFFSSFGQTFFISLLVPFWIVEIGITNSEFGSMYGLISVTSALTLPLFGRYIDLMPLRRYSLIIFIGLILSVALLTAANSFLLLLGGLFLVRLFGQGLMTHTASTGIAKLFDRERGKALAFTSLGHPAAQLILPFLFALVSALVSWRLSLILLALLSLFLMLPMIIRITPDKEKVDTSSQNGFGNKGKNHFLLSRTFWQGVRHRTTGTSAQLPLHHHGTGYRRRPPGTGNPARYPILNKPCHALGSPVDGGGLFGQPADESE